MPQYYLIPKRAARSFPVLGKAAMWLEARLLRGVFWLFERLSIEQALKLGAICFGLAGPHTSKAKKVERNLPDHLASSERVRRI